MHEERSSRFYTILQVEIMFFHTARRHLELAKEGWPAVEQALKVYCLSRKLIF